MSRTTPQVDAAAATSVGRVRSRNEDSYLLREGLYVVADGMGGHAAGDRASALAVAAMDRLPATFSPDDLLAAIGAANEDISAEGDLRPEEHGMGTTLTGLALVDAEEEPAWLVFNVGDSRVYQLRGGALELLTEDHSEIWPFVLSGQITAEEAEQHPLSSIVTRSLGREVSPLADHWTIPFAPGQVFLACSDGVPLELGTAELTALLGGAGTAQERADRIVAAVDEAGGRDNSTALVVLT